VRNDSKVKALMAFWVWFPSHATTLSLARLAVDIPLLPVQVPQGLQGKEEPTKDSLDKGVPKGSGQRDGHCTLLPLPLAVGA